MNKPSEHSLPDFQRQLQKALEGAASALDDFVGVRVALPLSLTNETDSNESEKKLNKEKITDSAQWWLLDAGDLQSTAQISNRNILGGLQPWVMGIAQIHGDIYTLADMSIILGLPVPAATRSWATLLNNRFDSNLALVWPHLIGMIPRQELTVIPGKPTHPWVRRQWRDNEGKVWNELAIEQLILSKQFEQVWVPAQNSLLDKNTLDKTIQEQKN